MMKTENPKITLEAISKRKEELRTEIAKQKARIDSYPNGLQFRLLPFRIHVLNFDFL